MNLTPGVKIVSDTAIKLSDRLSINTGIEDAIGSDCYREYDFMTGAVKPKQGWRSLTETEFNILTHIDSSSNFSNTICIKQIPLSITCIAEEVKLNNIKTLVELNDLFKDNYDRIVLFNERIQNFLQSLQMESQEDILEFRALCVTKPNLETLAFDNVTPPQYLGLHIDVTKGIDFMSTNLSFNRMCLSFGSEKRQLLIINKTIKDILDMISKKKPLLDLLSLSERQLVRIFFDLYPDYPVVRITQYPNELYIAPTDNIIHDGSTFGNEKVDIVLHARGYFDPMALN